MHGHFRLLYFYRGTNIGSEDTSETQHSGFLVKERVGRPVGEGAGPGRLQNKRAGMEPGNPGKKFPGILCVSIQYPDVLVAGELQPLKLHLDSVLFIRV